MQTIEDWLSQLGLSKYMEAFVQNDVDLRALPHITEADLRSLVSRLDIGKSFWLPSMDLGRLDRLVAMTVEDSKPLLSIGWTTQNDLEIR